MEKQTPWGHIWLLITSPLATPFSPIPSSPSLKKKNQESYSKNPIGKSWTGVHPVYSLIQIFRRLKAIVINQKWIIYLLSLISKETQVQSIYEDNKMYTVYDLKRQMIRNIKSLVIAFNDHFCRKTLINNKVYI
jgi:hypothetical protein